MSIKKKVVWLPYDMDTAIGINNSGLLVFSYNLEDTDLQQGGEFIFNGQDSVLWTNLRDAFGDQIKAMYQSLRSSGALSYDVVETAFEEHQEKWSEAIFNEDAFFKYIEPLTNPDAGKQPDASYLPMAQGSKAEQRKWWLYNRFRYMDSKFNAGDTLQDYIMMRAYAVAPQVLTPYADIYLTTAWDGELTQVRATRGQTYTLPCPKDTANDAVVAIYSASQLASVGDLSGLKIKSGNFSMATRIQSLKVGDSDPNYSNTNLTDLQLGNNTLLSVLDVRNCPNLAITVDISGCSNIEEVYFDGTSVAGVTLPNGGILRVLHLPDTITNLTVLNQQNITDLTVPDYSNVSTLRIENCGSTIMGDATKDMVKDIDTNARVRLIGINWEMDDGAEFKEVFDKINAGRGIDEQGGNMNIAQLQGAVHTPSASSSYFNTLVSRYPYVTFTADELTNMVKQYLEGTLTEYVDDGVTAIGQYSFYNMTTLTNVDAPNATTVGNNAFDGCNNLLTINLPGVTSISGQRAFNGCQSLQSMKLNGLLTLTQNYTIVNCYALTELVFQSLTSINGRFVINGCRTLKAIDFCVLGSLRGALALEGNASLDTVILRKTDAICTLGSNDIFNNTPFASGNAGGTLYVPSALISAYQSATNWSAILGYSTNSIQAIEGSIYETQYADGTPIE